MKKLTLCTIALVAVFLVSGCIDYTEEITLNEDGSGSVKMHVVLNKQFLRDMDKLAGEEGVETEESEDEICSEAEMRAALKEMNSGIELVEYTQNETDEIIEYRFEFKFNDYEDFKDLQYVCGEEDETTSETGFEFTYEKQADGSWLYRRFTSGHTAADDMAYENEEYDDSAYENDEEAPDEEYGDTDMSEADMQKLSEAMKGLGEAMQGIAGGETEGEDYDESSGADFNAMMEGMAASMQRAQEDMKNHKMIYIVHLPGTVKESNGTGTSGNTATWEYTLDKAEAMPSVLKAVVSD